MFDNTPASREGTLQSGDEITGVNGVHVKGKSKQEVAQIIQKCEVMTIKLSWLLLGNSMLVLLKISLSKFFVFMNVYS